MIVARRALVFLVLGSLGYAGAAVGQAPSSSEPSGRVGRLAFLQGTVSFHDADRTDWAPAMVNSPLTPGDAVWTEPNAHSEISIAGTRVRMDGGSQLDMVALDDSRTRLQLEQGRVDIKTFSYDTRQPYEIVTPRGVASLQQQGDYYVQAGSTDDPTRLGVRQGAAQFQTPNGQVVAVRAGEVVEVSGDGSAPQLHTIQAPPPPMPTYWAARDKVVVYDQPPQYVSAGVTGYEDLNYYGAWQSDPEYGQVWYAKSVPTGWSPYTTGRWTSDPVYGWTWVDEQPWGFAPYHYGRWAQRNNRWFWVPPDRQQRAVYAPALVAFLGGTELGLAIGAQNRQPVGWFPLGPREVYVPPYTTNRDYYRQLNLGARVQQNVLDDRWQRAQRHEALQDNNTWMNRRFARVVPAEDFARSRPVERSLIRVSADKIATAPVALVAAPPAPNQSIRAQQAPTAANQAQRPGEPSRPGEPNARPNMSPTQATSPTQAAAALIGIKPEPEHQRAPGPQVTTRTTATAPAPDQKPALPQLAPRNASAPPPPQIQGERRPADAKPGPQQATAPASQPTPPVQPSAATPPGGQPQANAPANRPGEPNRTQPPGAPTQPGQANLPPVRERNGQRPEPPNAPQATTTTPPVATAPQPTKPGEPPKSPQATTTAPQPPKPGEPPKSPQANTTAPQPAKPGEPPKSPQATTTAPQPPKPGEPPKSPQANTTAPQPAKPGEPSKPPQAQQQVQPPQHQAQPPKPPQAQGAPAQPQPPTPPAPQRPPERQGMNAPAPQPQHQPAPPPPQMQHQPAPPPPQRQAAPAAPPPQMQHQPAPQQQAHAPAPPPPQQAHAPSPPPQQAAPPRPAPQPQQAQQAPHPAPAPQQQQQQKPQPQPQQQGQQHKPDEKK